MPDTTTAPNVDELLRDTSTPEPVIRALVSGHLRIAAMVHGLRSAVELLGEEIEKEEDEAVRLALANAAGRSLLPTLSAVLSDDQANAAAAESDMIAGLLELLENGGVDHE